MRTDSSSRRLRVVQVFSFKRQDTCPSHPSWFPAELCQCLELSVLSPPLCCASAEGISSSGLQIQSVWEGRPLAAQLSDRLVSSTNQLLSSHGEIGLRANLITAKPADQF